MTVPIASVVIPAHNEEAVMGRCLGLLLSGSHPDELDVVVVANACTDRTAEIAREAGVRVVETSTPGKANALRLGDAECVAFPRIYADADVDIDRMSLRALVAAVGGTTMAAAPVPVWDLTGASGAVCRVHRVHEKLIAHRRGLAGVGVYVLTKHGHDRVFPLPDIISDDGLVDRSFAANERIIVSNATVMVRPARTIRAHINRRIRVRQGGRELDTLGMPLPHDRLTLGHVGKLLTERAISPVDAALYLTVLAADRIMTQVRGRSAGWSTDLTSRQTQNFKCG